MQVVVVLMWVLTVLTVGKGSVVGHVSVIDVRGWWWMRSTPSMLLVVTVRGWW